MCTYWAITGECVTNTDFMMKYCHKACSRCDDDSTGNTAELIISVCICFRFFCGTFHVGLLQGTSSNVCRLTSPNFPIWRNFDSQHQLCYTDLRRRFPVVNEVQSKCDPVFLLSHRKCPKCKCKLSIIWYSPTVNSKTALPLRFGMCTTAPADENWFCISVFSKRR